MSGRQSIGAGELATCLVDLVNQIRKTGPVDDHGHKLVMNRAYLEAVALLDEASCHEEGAETPKDVTDEMVTAYLTANDDYWRRADAMPLATRNPSQWRSGTPREATREGLRAAIAAAQESKP